jgi:hypothetical protein
MAAWARTPPAPRSRKVAMAATPTSHPLGLAHWKAAMPRNPAGAFVASSACLAVPIRQAIQQSIAAPPHFRTWRAAG